MKQLQMNGIFVYPNMSAHQRMEQLRSVDSSVPTIDSSGSLCVDTSISGVSLSVFCSSVSSVSGKVMQNVTQKIRLKLNAYLEKKT